MTMTTIGIGALIASAVLKKKDKVMDPKVAADRRAIYEATLNSKDPIKLRKMAAVFRQQGCTVEADMLDKRVALAEATPEVKKERREAFRKGMRSQDPLKVRALADAFDEIGATGAAADLHRYASGLEDALRAEAEGVTRHEP